MDHPYSSPSEFEALERPAAAAAAGVMAGVGGRTGGPCGFKIYPIAISNNQTGLVFSLAAAHRAHWNAQQIAIIICGRNALDTIIK